MQASLRRSVLSASLIVMASVLFAAPAGAMGRSTKPSPQTPDRVSRIEAEQQYIAMALQSQVEALRQEVAALKARVERQDVAAAD